MDDTALYHPCDCNHVYVYETENFRICNFAECNQFGLSSFCYPGNVSVIDLCFWRSGMDVGSISRPVIGQ